MEHPNLDYEPDSFEVKVEVGQPQQKSQLGGANKFYIYPIKGEDKHGSIDIYRRYSDFDHVRNALVARWPGCFITSLPEKKFLGNNEKEFVENRRCGLEEFLRIVSAISHLWYSEEMQLFLKTGSGDLQKQVASVVSRTNPIQLTSRYQIGFKSFQGIELTYEHNNKILQFSMYLKQVLPMLENLITIADTMSAAKKRQCQKYLTVIDFFLPEYEKNCISEYLLQKRQESLLFSNDGNSSLQETQAALRESLKKGSETGIISEWIKKQKREVLSFLDTIRVRDEFQAARQRAIAKVKECEIDKSKIQSGKSSVLAKIRSMSKQQQLQANQRQIESAILEQKQYTYIINMVNVLLAHIEIQKFKKLRERTYYGVLKKAALFEKENDKKLYQFWRTIGEHELIGTNKFMKEQARNIQREEQYHEPQQQQRREEINRLDNLMEEEPKKEEQAVQTQQEPTKQKSKNAEGQVPENTESEVHNDKQQQVPNGQEQQAEHSKQQQTEEVYQNQNDQ